MILVDALAEVRSMDPELSNMQKIDALDMRAIPFTRAVLVHIHASPVDSSKRVCLRLIYRP